MTHILCNWFLEHTDGIRARFSCTPNKQLKASSGLAEHPTCIISAHSRHSGSPRNEARQSGSRATGLRPALCCSPLAVAAGGREMVFISLSAINNETRIIKSILKCCPTTLLKGRLQQKRKLLIPWDQTLTFFWSIVGETSFLAHGSLLKSNVCLYLFNLCVVSVMYVCYGPCHKSGSPFTGKDFTTQTTLTRKTWNREQLWLAALFPRLNGLHDVHHPLIRKTISKHFLSVREPATSNWEMSA